MVGMTFQKPLSNSYTQLQPIYDRSHW